jgi:hypothetical protein
MTNDECRRNAEAGKRAANSTVQHSTFGFCFVIASRLPPLTLPGCGHLAPLPAGSIRHSEFVIIP